MGQRHQIYVVRREIETRGYKALGAFHHQWCYGLTAASSCVRLAAAIVRAKNCYDKWEAFCVNDPREIDVLVKSIYGVNPESGQISMVHNESEHLISETKQILPHLGDNNDGAALLVIDDIAKEVRICLFTPNHLEGEHGEACEKWKPYSPLEYLNFYYRGEQLEKILKDNPKISIAMGEEFLQGEFPVIKFVEFERIMAEAYAKGEINGHSS